MYKKKLVLIIKKIEKDYSKELNNTTKITKKNCESKQEINYLMNKKPKRRI